MASCPTVRSQVIRGILAAAALAGAYVAYAHSPPLSYALIAASLFAMRGCPACWVAGMCDAVKKPDTTAEKKPENLSS
ncbi:MAG: hypothetical protein PSY14_05270 [bacterium]|nr:hypothetical protein [bacterium]